MLEGKKENFWNKRNPTNSIEIPIDESVVDEKPPLVLYNSKAYYKEGLYVIVILFVVSNLGYLFYDRVFLLRDFLLTATVFSGLSLFAAIPLLDKRPRLAINSLGVETRNRHTSWREVKNMYLKKRSYMLGKYSLILVVEKDYHEKEEVVFTEKIEGTPEELATLIGGYYSTYLKRQSKLN